MPDGSTQPEVDALVEQLKAGNALAQEATQAIDQAVQSAHEIAGSLPDAPASSPPSPPHHPLPPPPHASDPAPAAPVRVPLKEELRQLLAIEVPVIVQLGARRLTVGEVMRFSVGAIIEFNKSADEELDLLVSNKAIGKGHAVKVGENFGIKISTISPVKETIRKLGGL